MLLADHKIDFMLLKITSAFLATSLIRTAVDFLRYNYTHVNDGYLNLLTTPDYRKIYVSFVIDCCAYICIVFATFCHLLTHDDFCSWRPKLDDVRLAVWCFFIKEISRHLKCVMLFCKRVILHRCHKLSCLWHRFFRLILPALHCVSRTSTGYSHTTSACNTTKRPKK